MLLAVEKANPSQAMETHLASLNSAPNFNAWMFSQYSDWIRWGKIWEIGSGTGNMTEFLRPANFLCATEYDDVFRASLERKFQNFERVKVEKVDLTQLDIQHFSDYGFDTIISTNVIEHIEDDIAALKAITATMKEETLLITLVPAHQWLYGAIDEFVGHFRRYSRKQLESHLEAAGQELLEIKYFNRLSALAWFLKFKILRSRSISEGDMAMVERILPLMKLMDSLPLPFGQSLIALSRKKRR